MTGRPLPVRVLEGHGRAYRHTWRGTTISAILTPVMFLAAMGVGLGSLVDAGRPDPLEGVSYLVWLTPGLLAATAMQNGAGDGAFPVMAGMRWIRTYHAAIHTPVRPRDLFLGNLAWACLRSTLVGAIFVVVAAAFDAIGLVRGFAALVPAIVTGMGFCAAVAAFMATRQSDQAMAGLFRFGVVPLFLFSGTFFPISQLPDLVRPVAFAVPLWHGVELTRSLALGTPTALAWWVHTAVVVGLLVVATPVGVHTFARRLQP